MHDTGYHEVLIDCPDAPNIRPASVLVSVSIACGLDGLVPAHRRKGWISGDRPSPISFGSDSDHWIDFYDVDDFVATG